jgi:hypothetical protein
MFALPHILRSVERDGTRRQALLGCGVIAPVVWVTLDVIGSLRYPGYSYLDQTISELSAQGAPTRNFMLAFSGTPYAVLLVAFGAGVWRTAGSRARGRATGALLIGEALWGYVGGIAFPMARREVIAAGQDTLRNQMHAWYGIGMPILLALAIGFGSGLLGRRFRSFSYATIIVMLVFGALMGLQASAMTANEPTPWMGIEERVTGYAPMLWMALLALGLLQAESATASRKPEKLLMRRQQRAAH